jgi:hypothetical protein
MPRFREVSETYQWPAHLAVYDPALWSGEQEWRAARADYAAENKWYEPGKFLVLNETRAMADRRPIVPPGCMLGSWCPPLPMIAQAGQNNNSRAINVRSS